MTLLDQFDGDIPEDIETDTEPIQCLHCGETNLTASPTESDGNTRWSEVACDDCGTTWQEVYSITLITNIEIGEIK